MSAAQRLFILEPERVLSGHRVLGGATPKLVKWVPRIRWWCGGVTLTQGGKFQAVDMGHEGA
jgi:hypothetical protein